MANKTINIVFDISIDANKSRSASSSTMELEDSIEDSGSSITYDKVFIYDIEDLTLMSKKRFVGGNEERSGLFRDISRVINLPFEGTNLDDPNQKDVVNILNVVDDGTEKTKTMMQNYLKLEKRIQTISEEYSESNNELPASFDDLELYLMTQRWTSAKKCLKMVNKRSDESMNQNYTNVVICEDGIAYGAAQTLVSDLWSQIPFQNIYSTATRETETVLKMIQKRFGKQCQLVVITSNDETMTAAESLLIPVWSVTPNEDFDALHNHHLNLWLSENEEDDEDEETITQKSWYEQIHEQMEETQRDDDNEMDRQRGAEEETLAEAQSRAMIEAQIQAETRVAALMMTGMSAQIETVKHVQAQARALAESLAESQNQALIQAAAQAAANAEAQAHAQGEAQAAALARAQAQAHSQAVIQTMRDQMEAMALAAQSQAEIMAQVQAHAHALSQAVIQFRTETAALNQAVGAQAQQQNFAQNQQELHRIFQQVSLQQPVLPVYTIDPTLQANPMYVQFMQALENPFQPRHL